MTSQCVSPSPSSNKHAKPFRNITPPTGDTVIARDISERREVFRFAKAKLQSEEKQTVVSEWGDGGEGCWWELCDVFLQRHFKKWASGEEDGWSLC